MCDEATRSSDARRILSPPSWQNLRESGMEAYFEKQASGFAPARTAMSVHVTARSPPSAMAAMEASRKGAAEP